MASMIVDETMTKEVASDILVKTAKAYHDKAIPKTEVKKYKTDLCAPFLQAAKKAKKKTAGGEASEGPAVKKQKTNKPKDDEAAKAKGKPKAKAAPKADEESTPVTPPPRAKAQAAAPPPPKSSGSGMRKAEAEELEKMMHEGW